MLRVAPAIALGYLVFMSAVSAAPPSPAQKFRVLVFTKTAEYRHDSIPAALAAITQLGAKGGFTVDATEDAGAFSNDNLARYKVVVFLLTTGDVLDPNQQAALTHYIEAGGGFVGVHSAADTEHDWPWYGGLVGAYFVSHPPIQPAVVNVVDRNTPSTIHLPARWTRMDEWYNFAPNPRGSVTVLATVDETSYAPGDHAMGADHPIMWQHVYDGGRSWYTGGGHTSESYSEPLYRSQLLGGILWAAGFDLPRIESLTSKVGRHRLTVTVTHPSCRRCDVRLTVHVHGRALSTTVPADGTRTYATTPALPPGHWRYTVILDDKGMAARADAARSVNVG
jgi:cytochrome c